MINEYRKLITLLENIESSNVAFNENNVSQIPPNTLKGNLFADNILAVANSAGWRSVKPNTKLYQILFSVSKSGVQRERRSYGIPEKINANELLFFFPRSKNPNLREFQEPIGDLSTVNNYLAKYKLQSQPSVEKQQDPSRGMWYILIDLAHGGYYHFPMYKTPSGSWEAPGSPGFHGLYYLPRLNIVDKKSCLAKIAAVFQKSRKFG